MRPIMHADVVIIRLVFAAVLVASGYVLKPLRIAAIRSMVSAAVGALIAICIILFELRIRRASLRHSSAQRSARSWESSVPF